MKTVGIVSLVVVGLLAAGIIPRLQRKQELEAEAASIHGAPRVNVVVVGHGAATSNLALPGSIEALHQTPIYARSTGYVARWMTDIGARVTNGQLLAEIESPDLDHQADQAKADLAQLNANLTLAKRTLVRWQEMAKDSVVTEFDVDTRQAAYDAAVASLKAGQENYGRLAQLQRYERVVAPFTGVVTSRNVDNGTLVTAGTAAATPLFTVAGTDTVRIYVSVPQSAMSLVHPGQTAEVSVGELAQKAFQGKVIRNARALDAGSRTLLTEIQIANPKGELLPGMYADVRFLITSTDPTIVIPANALVVRSDGPQVALIGRGDVVHYQKVQLGRDFGSQVEITSGLESGARLVVNPGNDIREGVTVAALPLVTDTK